MPMGFHTQPASHKRKKAYVIGEHIGAGGYGEVKSAVALEMANTVVAIKIIPKIHVKDYDEQVSRQDTLAGLKHPHVVHLIEWFESITKFYIVFELAAGGELYDHLMDEGKFEEDEAREVAFALVDAVKYLHDRNIIHRDLKPENILYRTPPGQNGVGHDDCVVSDFGLALKLDSDHQVLHTHCGSPGYSAPEVYSPEGYSLPADMWSVGIIVFALMGGRFPYKEVEPRALAEEARTTRLYFPEKPWNGISEAAKHFIQGLLRVNPKKRLTAAQALDHPWLRAAISRPASPAHSVPGETTPTHEASATKGLFSSEHPALERLKISSDVPARAPHFASGSATSTPASSVPTTPRAPSSSTVSSSSYPIMERRETMTGEGKTKAKTGKDTPRLNSPTGTHETDFPELEKRATNIGNEDDAVIL